MWRHALNWSAGTELCGHDALKKFSYLLQVILLHPSDFWMGAWHFGQALVFSVRYVSDIKLSVITSSRRFPYRFSNKVFFFGSEFIYSLSKACCSWECILKKKSSWKLHKNGFSAHTVTKLYFLSENPKDHLFNK